MNAPAAGLASLVRPLPVGRGGGTGRWLAIGLEGGLRLVVAPATVGRDALMKVARGPVAGSAATSRSAAGEWRGVIVAPAGRVGLDIETLTRIALDAAADDPWLAPAERLLVAEAAEPLLELACHWVLKEAYGKALGVGLALPLDRLAFGVEGGVAVLKGDAAPPGSARWSFPLYRRGDAIFGIARRDRPQATPLAPAGRKPPVPVPER